MAVTVRKHAKEDALKRETFGPLFAYRGWQFHFEIFKLIYQMIDFLLDQVLLFRTLSIRSTNSFALHVVEILEKLLDLGHLKVVKANGPNEPIEMFFELKVLSGDDETIKGTWLHIGQPLAHLDLFLHPISVS